MWFVYLYDRIYMVGFVPGNVVKVSWMYCAISVRKAL